MTDPNHCDHPCGLTCPPNACAVHSTPAPIVLAEALTRFAREAKPGTINTGRYRLPYYVWGEGPPLVFVHGAGDTSLSFIQPIARLSQHFRCVAYDLPGNPGDGSQLRRITHDDLAEDLFKLLDHLALERAYIVGSSFGSTIVLKALATQPARLPRAVLQGGFAFRPLRRAECWLAHIGRYLPGRTLQLPLRRRILHRVNHAFFAVRTPDVWKNFIENTGLARTATFARQALMLHALDLRPLLPEVRQPILLVGGDRDRVVPRVFEDMLHAGLPNVGRVTIERCGHHPMYTHPEIFAEVVRQFFTLPEQGQGQGQGSARTGPCP